MEFASAVTRNMIETLLHVHALTNMHRASENDQYRETAAGWLPSLDAQLSILKRELTKVHIE